MRFGKTPKGKALHIIASQRASIPFSWPVSYCGRRVMPKDVPTTTGDWFLNLKGIKGFKVGRWGNACEVCVAGAVRHKKK